MELELHKFLEENVRSNQHIIISNNILNSREYYYEGTVRELYSDEVADELLYMKVASVEADPNYPGYLIIAVHKGWLY